MTGLELAGFSAAILVMLLGVVGCVLPGVPGAPLVFVAALAHRLCFGQASVGNWGLAVMFGLMLLSLALDFLASVMGAKAMGATWKGIVGAVVGMLVGMLFSLPGLVVGPFVGAFLFEYVGGKDGGASAKAGVGALIGLVLGSLGRVVCAMTMAGLFAVMVVQRATLPATSTPAAMNSGPHGPRASMNPPALAKVSSYSASGIESATMPAPTWK